MPGKLGPAARVLVLKLHPCRAARISLSVNPQPGAFDQRRRLCRFVVELLPFAGLGAIAASGHDQRYGSVGIGQPEMQGRETTHRNANDMCLGDRETVEHGADIVPSAFLGIAGRIIWYVGRRVAPGVVRDAAIAPRKVAYLRFKAAIIVSKFMDEDDRRARPSLLVIQADAVIGGDVGHLGPFDTEAGAS